MVYHKITYYCSTCHSRHASYDDAQDCESNHVTDKLIMDFRDKLAAIFQKPKKKAKAKLKPKSEDI